MIKKFERFEFNEDLEEEDPNIDKDLFLAIDNGDYYICVINSNRKLEILNHKHWNYDFDLKIFGGEIDENEYIWIYDFHNLYKTINIDRSVDSEWKKYKINQLPENIKNRLNY